MLPGKPPDNFCPQFVCELQQVHRLFRRYLSHRVVLGDVSLGSAPIQVIRVALAPGTKNHRQSLQCSVVREILLGSKALTVEQHGAQLEHGVVSDPKFPIVGNPPGRVLQVAIRDGLQGWRLAAGWSHTAAAIRS